MTWLFTGLGLSYHDALSGLNRTLYFMPRLRLWLCDATPSGLLSKSLLVLVKNQVAGGMIVRLKEILKLNLEENPLQIKPWQNQNIHHRFVFSRFCLSFLYAK